MTDHSSRAPRNLPVFLYPKDAALDPAVSLAAKGLLAYMYAVDSDETRDDPDLLDMSPLGLNPGELEALFAELTRAGHASDFRQGQ